MDRVLDILRGVITALGWVCGLLALATPLLFLVAALGTRWEFWDWSFGLLTLTHVWGQGMIWATLGTAVLTILLMVMHRILGKDSHGVVSAPVLALVVGVAALSWTLVFEQRRNAVAVVLDVTTDVVEVPHFSSAFRARYGALVDQLDYAAKTGAEGRPLSQIQQEVYPGLTSLHVDAEPRIVFRRALLLARETGWSIGTASEQAGMFEAGAESFWFGFRDDMVIRVRAAEDGGSIVDMRSIARQSVNDLGRNPQRVMNFLAALETAQPQG